MRMPIIIIVSWLAVMAGVAAGQTLTATIPEHNATVSGVTVTNVGIYTGQSTSAPARAGQASPTGTIGTAADWHFVSTGQDIPGKVGTQFGIEFRIDGAPAGDT
jgi:hypothetical protein